MSSKTNLKTKELNEQSKEVEDDYSPSYTDMEDALKSVSLLTKG